MRYRAFISYSHADEAVARRLHGALEAYVLPRRVRNAHGLPRRLIPIFRDVDELAAESGLTTRLQDALDQSQWLIVLCSPAAAQSRYVNQEIEYFLRRHGAQRVLCALASGEPPDCFPPAIRALGDEPLAADIRAGRDQDLAKIKLVATLAGVGFTELRNREAQRRKRRQALIAAALAAAGLGAIACWDLFYREHVDYYASYVRRDGIWEGVDPLGPAVAARRAETLRFTRRGRLNPPTQVDLVNAQGFCAGDGLENIVGRKLALDLEQPAQRYCTAAFTYAADGSLRNEVLLNRRGVAMDALTYTTPELAQFTQDGFAAAGSHGGIYYVQFRRDARGRDVERHFLHSRGVPRPNDERAFGYYYTYDDADRVIRRSALDADGNDSGDATSLEWNDSGALIVERLLDRGGKPRWSPQGHSAIRYERDVYGNVTARHFLGADGGPTVVGEGWASLQYALNPAGLVEEVRYLDARGEVLRDAAVALRRHSYDERGNVLSERPLDAGGQPAVVEGIAETRMHYDEHDDPVLISFHDADGRPAAHQVGNASNRKRFDERGYLVEQTFLGLDGQRVNTGFGASIRTDFDARGNRLSFRFFGADGQPFVRPERGFATALFGYDERGNQVTAEFFGASGERVVNQFGVARWQKIYDDQGNQVEVRYYDATGRPTTMKLAAAIVRRGYDRAGNEITSRYFGPDGAPAADPEGGYGYDIEYDARGRVIRTTALGVDEKPVLLGGGYCIVETRYDPRGPIAEVRFLGTTAESPPPGRAARRLHHYDRDAREVEQRSEDVAGAVAPEPNTGCPILRTEYDSTGRIVAQRCSDADGRPVMRRDGAWATRLLRYEHGRIVEERKLDASGR